jgi:hypothetical protein
MEAFGTTWFMTTCRLAESNQCLLSTPYVSKIKVMFGHKLRYEIKVTFGEISLKLRRTNWNIAINIVNVVAKELPSHIGIYTCLVNDNWT